MTYDCDEYMVFENKKNQELKYRMEELPEVMQNPYVMLKRFIKWEQLDLESMVEMVESKEEIIKFRQATQQSKQKDCQEQYKL